MSHAREKGPSARFAASELSPRGIARSAASHVLRDSGASHGFAHCPTCAICGGRDATTRTDWPNDDGSTRSVPACAGCSGEDTSKRARVPHNGQKTHCKHGHAFTPENTKVLRDGAERRCIACEKARSRARYENHRKAA